MGVQTVGAVVSSSLELDDQGVNVLDDPGCAPASESVISNVPRKRRALEHSLLAALGGAIEDRRDDLLEVVLALALKDDARDRLRE